MELASSEEKNKEAEAQQPKPKPIPKQAKLTPRELRASAIAERIEQGKCLYCTENATAYRPHYQLVTTFADYIASLFGVIVSKRRVIRFSRSSGFLWSNAHYPFEVCEKHASWLASLLEGRLLRSFEELKILETKQQAELYDYELYGADEAIMIDMKGIMQKTTEEPNQNNVAVSLPPSTTT
jgi:hypothetical protein